MSTINNDVNHPYHKEHQLAANSLGILESLVMGTAGAAPAFSLSTASVPLIAVVGVLAPASILYCGLLMFGITLAFMHLNKVMSNAGASYAWVTKIFGRSLGFFAGWALLVASALFMVAGSIPAATATLLLISPDSVSHPGRVTLVAALWLTLISAITIKGIKPTSYAQLLMTGVEMFILILIIGAGIYQFSTHPAHVFSWSWLSLTNFTPHTFSTGALTAIFLYWGWDVTLNLNEETKNTRHAPGWGAFWSVFIVIVLFICFSIVTLLVLSDNEIQTADTNIIIAIADKLFPRPWGYLAVLCVLLSSAGTLETTIVQFTRTLFAEARDGASHPRFAKIHPTWQTPWIAVFFIWGFGLLFLGLSSSFSTISLIIKDSVNAISFQVAFYYSLTGMACAWYYRRMWRGVLELIGYVIWPMGSALFLIFIACFSIPTFDAITLSIGLGGIALGIIPWTWNARVQKK